jgi:ubiquinone/menaquinone biosynthesis C-methylase UbiE
VGTGRFAQALNITHGADPSLGMLELARKRNIVCTQAVAENLPFKNKSFDLALMVTVDCFLIDLKQAFSEIYRILKPDGRLVLGMIDMNSELGKTYEKKQPENKFYRYARFRSVEEISEFLHEAGLRKVTTVQTLFRPLRMIENAEPVKYGYGEGGFVAISAIKEKHDS